MSWNDEIDPLHRRKKWTTHTPLSECVSWSVPDYCHHHLPLQHGAALAGLQVLQPLSSHLHGFPLLSISTEAYEVSSMYQFRLITLVCKNMVVDILLLDEWYGLELVGEVGV